MDRTRDDKFKLEFLIDKILPRRKVHMLAGPSGAGKTTLLFSILKDWSAGRDVWGFKSTPVPWHYIALDRPYDETGKIIENQGLDPRILPITCNLSKNVVLEDLIRDHEDARLLVIEAILLLQPGDGDVGNSYRGVANFLRDAVALCEEHDVTIIGTPHLAKQKEGNRFTNSREKVLGSVSWGAFASTHMILEKKNPHIKDDPHRILEVLPRVAPEFIIEMVMTPEGRLEPTSPIEAGGRQTSPDAEVQLLLSIPSGGQCSTARIVEHARGLDMSKATVMRYLRKWVDEKRLIKTGQGRYSRPQQ